MRDAKYLLTEQLRQKYKKQCLRQKNVLFENDSLQIGSKIQPLYDLYTSQYYVDVSLFIGNKSDADLDGYSLQYRGTPNLTTFIEPTPRTIAAKTQQRQRIILSCANLEQELLLVYEFQSRGVTIRSGVLPVSLWSFCVFSPVEPIPLAQMHSTLSRKYEYTEDILITFTQWKKDPQSQLKKCFPLLIPCGSNTHYGMFYLKSFLLQYAIVFVIMERQIKVSLYSGQYYCFDTLLQTIKYLLQ